ncbi:MAG: type VI secretion system baseplate subunit TssK [Candidatus Eisenbacteria bacterium]
MSRHQSVVWSEGLLLTPQHFQQWDRATHHLVAERLRAAHPFEWGLTHLEVDREALRNGRIALQAVRGVLPDGTPVAAPEDDPLPAPRDIAGHFEPRQESLLIHVGVPALRPGRAMLSQNGGGSDGVAPRFVTDTLDLPDANTGLDERPVVTARRNLRLLFPDDALGDHDAVPFAELVRSGENAFALREAYVPPCLALSASETLMKQVRSEFEMLVTKSNNLGDKRRQRGGFADFADTDAASFWMLGTVNAAIPLLGHYLSHPRVHPEEVYRALAALVGQLCTVSAEVHPKDFPAYDHMGQGRTFAQIHEWLGKVIQPDTADKAIRIDLKKEDSSLYVGSVVDPRVLESAATMYLGVKADAEEQRLINEVPYKVKIASRDKIDYLIANALRGVVVNYTRVTPSALPVKANFLYYQLDTQGDAFETVRGAKNIAIFLPPDYPGMTIELLGLRP